MAADTRDVGRLWRAFIGAAFYFGYGVLRPFVWNAIGQLWAFLAYDLVLIVPFVLHVITVEPGLMPNLIVYIAVLVYSGALSVWFLFVRPLSARR